MSGILIAGGSIAGLTTALSLRTAGHRDITVTDAGDEGRDGGLITITDDNQERLAVLGIDNKKWLFGGPSLYVDGHEDEIQIIFGGGIREMTTWARLRAALLVKCQESGITITHGRVRPRIPRLYRDHDHVVFADGRMSAGRRYLQPWRTLSYDGVTCFRGYSPLPSREEFSHARLDGQRNEGHVVYAQTPAGGTDWNMFLAIGEEQARGFSPLLAYVPDGGQQARDMAVTTSRRLREAAMKDIIAATERVSIVPAVAVTPATTMTVGKSTLLGDAFWPLSPLSGAGANLAIYEGTEFGQRYGRQGWEGEMDNQFIPMLTSISASAARHDLELAKHEPY